MGSVLPAQLCKVKEEGIYIFLIVPIITRVGDTHGNTDADLRDKRRETRRQKDIKRGNDNVKHIRGY